MDTEEKKQDCLGGCGKKLPRLQFFCPECKKKKDAMRISNAYLNIYATPKKPKKSIN